MVHIYIYICVGNPTIIGSDNGLSPGRRQAIIWTNEGLLLIGPPGTTFSEIVIEIHTFSFTKMHFKMSSVKWRQFVSASMCLECAITIPKASFIEKNYNILRDNIISNPRILNKMSDISQRIPSDAFHWNKIIFSWFEFHRNMLLRVQNDNFQVSSGNGFDPNRWQAITCSQWSPNFVTPYGDRNIYDFWMMQIRI